MHEKFFTGPWSSKTPPKSHFFNVFWTQNRTFEWVPKFKNHSLLTFPAIKMDWRIIWSPNWILWIAMILKKCLTIFFNVQTQLYTFLSPQNIVDMNFWNTFFSMRFLLNFYKNIKNNAKNMKNRSLRTFRSIKKDSRWF